MAEVVLFHHAQGLTPGIAAFADELRHAEHTVHTPDLFEGRTFGSLQEGLDFVEQVGFGEMIERGTRAVEGLPAELVYAGFSLGVLPAQKLAQTRPGARGALLFYSCVPVTEFSPIWPDDVPTQIHGMDADPIFVGEGDIDAARALVSRPRTRNCSCTQATSTTSPTAPCRVSTPKPPRCSSSAYWSSSAPGNARRVAWGALCCSQSNSRVPPTQLSRTVSRTFDPARTVAPPFLPALPPVLFHTFVLLVAKAWRQYS